MKNDKNITFSILNKIKYNFFEYKDTLTTKNFKKTYH
jgi:hypothetical protein